MRFFSWVLFAPLFFSFSCSKQSSWSNKARELDRFSIELVKELQEVHSQRDLEERKDQIKNLFQLFVRQMIDLDRDRRSNGFDKEVRTQLFHLKELEKELHRVQKIAGCKEMIEICQRDALHLLDSYDRKLQRIDPFEAFQKKHSPFLR
jgi:hypothetical protein